jgi:hypothetical protein
MDNEKILGVYPIETIGKGLYRLFDAYYTDQRVIGNYREGRAFFTKFYGPGCVLWGYRFLDYAIVLPLTRRKNFSTSKDPEEILKSDKRNMYISYKDIKSATFKRVRGSWGQYMIQLEFPVGKPQRINYDPKQREEVIKIWQEVLRDKVTVLDN